MKTTEYTEGKYPYSKITEKIIKCVIEVHKTLGPDFVENIYENALVYEMKQEKLRVEEQKLVSVLYKGVKVGEHRLDLLVENAVIVENKVVKEFNEIHQAQILSYLRATDRRIGLLINFAKTRIEVKRIIL